MPVLRAVVPTAVLVVGQRGSLWTRLQALARRALTPLATFWRQVFTDVRREQDAGAITQALRSAHLLDAEQEVMGIWRRYGEDEARSGLPGLLLGLMRRTATIVHRTLEETAGRRLDMPSDFGESQQEANRVANAHVTLVTQTTLLGLRHLLREGWLANQVPEAHAALITQGFGLTPQQIRSLSAAQARWRQDGRSATEMQDATLQAIALGLAHRVRAMAETQAFGTVNVGHRLAMTHTAQTTLGGGAQLRRYWQTQPGACAECRAIASMNAAGVGLSEGFQTSSGVLMDPPAHVWCRCMPAYRVPS
jgi:hypothetical protein